jgi:hypothetical protein
MMTGRAWAAALLAGGWMLAGCGSSNWTLLYKPLTGERVEFPFPSSPKEDEGVAVYVAPEARRVIGGGASGQQEFVVELLVWNRRDEPIAFQSRNVSIVADGATGRSVDNIEAVLKPGEYTGRYELHIPVSGRGKPDPRDDKVELVVEAKGATSGKTIPVRVRLMFVASQL